MCTKLTLVVTVFIYTVCTVAIPCDNCGKISVPYPLSTGPTCGNQWYRVRCDKGTLKFDTLNNTYTIVSISPENQRLVIRQSTLLPDTCVAADLPTRGIQLNNSLPFTIAYSNTVLFFNCSDRLESGALDCSPASLCRTYLNGSPEMSACRRAQLCCSFQKGSSTNVNYVRVTMERCRAYRSFVNLDEWSPVSQWPDPAVELTWKMPVERPCDTQEDCCAISTCGDGQGGVRRCLCNPNYHWNATAGLCVSALKNVRSKRIVLVASTICSAGIFSVSVVFATITYIRHRRIKQVRHRLTREREEILAVKGAGKSAKIFTGKEIKKATNSFSSTGLLGAGGFGEVYKGVLDDGTTVAVKSAKLGNTKSSDQVLNEVRILCQVNHKNLVHLLGCCVELEQPLLVYEFIPNGSLFDHLHDQKKEPLPWNHRLSIAHGTAEGLSYLHSSASPPIYHRDVKSSNILLDQNMNAKVADFGLSRLAHSDLTHVTTCAQGTLGYLDPDYYWNYQLTDKSDVYSFGVLLLEILTCQRVIDFGRPPNDVNLVAYVKRVVNEERLVDVIDPRIKNGATSLEIDAMKALGFLAMSCLEEHRDNRPSMKEACEEIEYIMGIVGINKKK